MHRNETIDLVTYTLLINLSDVCFNLGALKAPPTTSIVNKAVHE